MLAAHPPAIELWGGVEATVLRVGSEWRDQIRATGHHDRETDLDRIAELGIRTLRYPVLWERCVDGPAHAGWGWHDIRLRRLRHLGITPVAGLMHHGSGPPGTDLLDPGLPAALALHAAAAAARYPWIEAWTPVNEPLTTARFSGLYGHWHPHANSETAFLVMLATQCRAVLLSMRAIRRHIPGAHLVQTEDIGRVFATPMLQYQADYENERRWLSLDLLQGRVDRSHPWWDRFAAAGVPHAWLKDFQGGDAVPDLIGVNHYVTSDRFLDHRTGLYPHHGQAGNGRHSYVDTEAVRAHVDGLELGWTARLREVQARYRRPMAITEAHLGCLDEAESVRWFAEAWQAAECLRAEGAELRAVTAWALFGAVDWDSLLRQQRHHYEAGVWDAAVDPPRPTLLAEALLSIGRTGSFQHPVLASPGWWRRDDRLYPVRRSA